MAAISSLGIGSGLDLGSLISGLVEAERAPTENRLSFKEQSITTELSAFGLLRSSLSQFQSSLSGLQSSSAFDAKTSTLSNSSLFSATVENFADVGSYSVEVTALARSHSLASNAATAFSSVDDTVGSGNLSIQFGTTTTGPYSFSADVSKPALDIEVSVANNNTTLSGLRDYINDNDYDVQASIINDGNGYRLVLTSQSTGAANSMEITVSGDGDGDDLDNGGLSQLAFNASAQSSLTQTVAAQDAALTINGLDITRDKNEITGAIDGVTLNLLEADVGNIIQVDIAENRSAITNSINTFVGSYNELMNSIKSLTSYNAESGSGSVLTGDFTVRSIASQVRSLVFGRIPGLQGNIRSLVDIGITTNSNGTLDVDSSALQDALLNNAGAVEGLFSLQGQSSSASLNYLSASNETQPGTYAVNVNSYETQGVFTGTGPVSALQVQNNNNNLTLTVDGVSTGNITLTGGIYLNETDLASEIQAQINAAGPLVTAGKSVTVSYNATSDRFVITSNTQGSESTVAVTAIDSQSSADFGITVGNGVDGTDQSATINGAAASFNGNILTSTSGNSIGLAVELLNSGTGNLGSITLSKGLAARLDDLLDGFLLSDGTIAAREESLNDGLEEISDDRSRLDERISKLEARLVRQFTALDVLVAQFNQTSSFLTQQLANLPKPNSISN